MRRPRVSLLLAVLVLLAHVATADAAQTRKKAIWGPLSVNGVSQFPIYRNLGVGILQLNLNWDTVARSRPQRPRDPSDPVYQWPAQIDHAIAEGRRYGIRISLQIAGFPPWANGHRPRQWAARRPSDFAAFATAASRRFPRVRLWQILGEPSRKENFMPLSWRSKRGPRIYAQLLDASYGSLKRVNRRNLVIGGNTFTVGTQLPRKYIKAMKLPNGRAPRMDLYGHNPFTARRPDLRKKPTGTGHALDFSDLDTLALLLDRELRRKGVPIFISELTWPTDRLGHEFNFYVTRETQARWLGDAFRIVRRWRRIYTLGWVTLHDENPRPDGRQSNRGLLDWVGRRKPAYYVYRQG